MTTTARGSEWYGWLREAGGPWRLACTAASERDCWRALLAVEVRAAYVERFASRSGRNPDHRARPR